MKGTCQHCGRWRKSLYHHWSDVGCPYPPLTQRQRELCIGLLMGDGTLKDREDNGKTKLIVTSTRPSFLEWVDDQLGWLSQSLTKIQSARSPRPSTKESVDGINDETTLKPVYQIYTGPHPFFEELSSWYKSGEIRYPQDLEITPLIAKMWYCSDGGLHYRDGRATASITTVNERDRGDMLESFFDDTPPSPSYYKSANRLEFNRTETALFLEWIGEPPSGMRYKWITDNRELYDCAKTFHKDNVTTHKSTGFDPADLDPHHDIEHNRFPYHETSSMPFFIRAGCSTRNRGDSVTGE